MDKHERGWEISEDRLDMPLPKWNGSYRGDRRKLPRVVQKLLHGGAKLTAEEKAELLWRFYELDQRARTRRGRLLATVVLLGIVGSLLYVAAYPPHWLRERMLFLLNFVGGTDPR